MTTYTIPGAALQILRDNAHTQAVEPTHPDYQLNSAGAAFEAATPAKVGFGTRHATELTEEQHEALCDYLDGVADLHRHMSAEERSDNEIYACEAALKALLPDY